MYKVKKRDGSLTDFDINKIMHAISSAFEASHYEYTEDVIHLIALRVTSDFQNKIENGLIDVEKIQDSVEKILSETGYTEVAKSYILYRKQRETIRNINATSLDYESLVGSYLQGEDNHTYSIGGLILSNSAAITANYWLREVYDEEISQAHRSGMIHIHELSMLAPSNAEWSIQTLMERGLGGVINKTSAGPAKHLNTLVEQMVNFLGILQNEWAGAQTFDHFDTYLAPFVKKDNLSYKAIKQSMQSFIYGSNISSRWGTQAPYVRVILDTKVPNQFKDQTVVIGNEQLPFTFAQCQKEMDLINQAFLEVLMEGDYHHQPFPYPHVLIRFDVAQDDINFDFINLALQNKNIQFQFGESSQRFGSIGVVSLNVRRIAYLSKDKQQFAQELKKYVQLCMRTLKTKRDVLNRLLTSGLYPYTKVYLGSFEQLYSSLGVDLDGVYENCEWIKDEDKASFEHQVLQEIQKICMSFDQSSSEIRVHHISTSKERFHRLDANQYPEMKMSQNDETDLFEMLDHQKVKYDQLKINHVVNVTLQDGTDEKACFYFLKKIVNKYGFTNFKIEVK